MKPYEITYIIRPDLDEDQTRAAADAITRRLEAAGAEVVVTYPWHPPRRRLAYPIRDFGDGFYVTTVFHIDPPALGEFENALKLNENVLRFLLVQATDLTMKQAQQRAQQPVAEAAPVEPAPSPAPVPEEAAPAPTSEVAEATPPAEPAAPRAEPDSADVEPVAPVPVTAEAQPPTPPATPVEEPAQDAGTPEEEPAGTQA